MSVYMLFTAPKEGVASYLWKINKWGEIVVEALEANASGIVSSGREMAVMGNTRESYSLVANLNLALSKIHNGQLTVTSRVHLYHYGVSDIDELVVRLNAKGSNQAKILMRSLPPELRCNGVSWNSQTNKYEKAASTSDAE